MDSKFVLVDGHALLHRAFHALPPLSTSKGELVNAAYGFTMMLLRVLNGLKPEYVAVAFDRAAPTFRHTQYTAYKAHRTKAPDELYDQLERVKEIVSTLNIPIFELDGYEADDVIGALVKQGTENGIQDLEIFIVTGDRDTLQLVQPQVNVYTPGKSFSDVIIFDEKKVEEKYGLRPKQLIDFKSLAGDQSDNIPGVKGVGEVSAVKLLQKYGTTENLYRHLSEVPERIKRLLEEGSEEAALSKKLATIDVDAPVKLDLSCCRLRDYNHEKAVELFKELEFKTLISRLPDSDQEEKKEVGLEVVTGQGKLDFDQGVEKEAPLEVVLTGMRKVGVLVDTEILSNISTELSGKIVEIEKEIYSSVGHEFNLNSPKQLSEVLYSELNLTPGKKGKNHLSTDVSTLLNLIGAHPVVELILQYRELFKLKSTYTDSLPALVDRSDDRIHPDWHADVTRTGRLSCTNPNLQNIPVKGEWGAKIRQAFIASPTHLLLSGDYNQIELRVMAHLSGDPNLIEIFQQGKDIHATTASWIFNKSPEEITKDERRVAKTVNFGVLYGMSAFGLGQELRIDPKIASKFIERYYQRFSRVKLYQAEVLKEAYEKGYVETLSGFRRYVLELKSPNPRIRSQGERMATNMPVQGTAADIIKEAMVKIFADILDNGLGTRLIMQVHDELVFEVPKEEMDKVSSMIKERMEKAIRLSVPVVVDLKVGNNWAQTEERHFKEN
ncbi:MAG: DNA polymerase I [Patescibacteria group bacterium]|nr:DNA polymerase I [Patescibacteria group bacterium]